MEDIKYLHNLLYKPLWKNFLGLIKINKLLTSKNDVVITPPFLSMAAIVGSLAHWTSILIFALKWSAP